MTPIEAALFAWLVGLALFLLMAKTYLDLLKRSGKTEEDGARFARMKAVTGHKASPFWPTYGSAHRMRNELRIWLMSSISLRIP